MGKQQKEPLQQVGAQKTEQKKIIKKFPFKQLKSKADSNDKDLNEWKPVKLSQLKAQQKKQIEKEKGNIADSFLSSLSKPAVKNQTKSPFEPKNLIFKSVKAPATIEPTAEQIKWDIEDQTFIKKQFEPSKPLQHELVEQEEDEVIVDRIKWLNQEPKMKEIDLTKEVDKNWKAAATKSEFQTDIWSTSFIKGKGQLSNFVKQAISKFEEDELTMNRRAMIKQKNRQRYGW